MPLEKYEILLGFSSFLFYYNYGYIVTIVNGIFKHLD